MKNSFKNDVVYIFLKYHLNYTSFFIAFFLQMMGNLIGDRFVQLIKSTFTNDPVKIATRQPGMFSLCIFGNRVNCGVLLSLILWLVCFLVAYFV